MFCVFTESFFIHIEFVYNLFFLDILNPAEIHKNVSFSEIRSLFLFES